MKAAGLFQSVVAFFLLFATLSAATWADSLFEGVDGLILRRQNAKATSAAASGTAANTAAASGTEQNSAAASASETAAASATGTAAASGSGTDASSHKGSKTTGKASKSTAVDPRLPPGGVAMITPSPFDGEQYYKVGDYVTFAWNYTSLSNTPSAIDVIASCSLNSATYTIAANMSVDATATLVWDTGASETISNPFPVATYTLIIHDSSLDADAVASAGDLGAYNQYQFGMYTGQPYTPLSEFRCATCSSAVSLHEKQAMGVLLVTSLVTILSFTWFC